MLIPMATLFSNFHRASAPKIVDEYFMKQSYVTRYPGVLFSSTQSSYFWLSTRNFFQNTYTRHQVFKQQDRYQQFHSKGKADYSGSMHDQENKDDVSRATLIWRAIKLPIYSVALVPLTVGSAAAYLQMGIFSARRYFVLLLSSILIITWLNLSNDVYDFDTGADKNKKESVVNLVGSRTGTLVAAYLLLVLAFTGLIWASVEAGNIRAILLLTCAVTCGYIYQCPPFRLSYQGLGEPLCFAAFGPFATTAFYLLLGSTSENLCISITGTASFCITPCWLDNNLDSLL
ncbi:1,4-dihydroxy-2-naphthoate polyprenyltransferase, chloroplastic-like protein [Melia azedarach]|uniref:1,4-dihydroxy-2-naphthoate polyprenyltransferase, chloroplastic-like protein n=1 Tax=Melia azedarach TaxID=155640 RepID=A0ACC1XZI1_MELAZ|nr:1,4-dihydroxy-2-naphthoate polyprenyltransferase, chloroplastic-like protein [Melia azedarach]